MAAPRNVRVGSVRIDGEDVPVAGDALERVKAAVRELQAGTGHQVLDRVRHQHFAAAGQRGDAGADVDGDATELGPHDLALARVQAGPDVEPELPDRRADLAGGPDAAGRAVEGREKAVARGVDL